MSARERQHARHDCEQPLRSHELERPSQARGEELRVALADARKLRVAGKQPKGSNLHAATAQSVVIEATGKAGHQEPEALECELSIIRIARFV